MIKLFILFISVALDTCFGFSSVIGNQSRNGHDVHSRITHSVSSQMGFSYISYRILVSGIVSADYYQNLIDDAGMHCDRNREKTHMEAIKNCHEKFKKEIKIAKYNLTEKKYLKSIYKLGQALHIIQDLISHSNISILPIKVQNQILNEFLEEKSISTFKGLKITYWDYRDNKKDDFSKKAKYIHDKYSLDHPTKNSFGKKIHPYDPKQTQYEIAYRLARKVTRRAILLYFSNFKKAEINNIKQYNL